MDPHRMRSHQVGDQLPRCPHQAALPKGRPDTGVSRCIADTQRNPRHHRTAREAANPSGTRRADRRGAARTPHEGHQMLKPPWSKSSPDTQRADNAPSRRGLRLFACVPAKSTRLALGQRERGSGRATLSPPEKLITSFACPYAVLEIICCVAVREPPSGWDRGLVYPDRL
jgi:hypothetical protein